MKVGYFTSLMPRSKPAPIAWVLSDIWKMAAKTMSRLAIISTSGLVLKNFGSWFLNTPNIIAQKVPYMTATINVLLPMADIFNQSLRPYALLTRMDPACARPMETINVNDAQLKAIW